MNLQEVNNISIIEGTVRTIHDSNGVQLWGQNLWDFTGLVSSSGTNFESTFEDGVLSVTWTGGFDLFPKNGDSDTLTLDNTKTYTLFVDVEGSSLVFKIRGGETLFTTSSSQSFVTYHTTLSNLNSLRLDIVRAQSTAGSATIKNLRVVLNETLS